MEERFGGKGRIRILGGPALRVAYVVSFLLASPAHAAAESAFYLHPSDRVVFYGGAPALGQFDAALIETYVATRFPKMDVEFLHRGWDGRWARPAKQDPSGPAQEIVGLRPTVVALGPAEPAAGDPPDAAGYTAAYTLLAGKLWEAIPGLRITVVQPGPPSGNDPSRTLAGEKNLLVHRREAIAPAASDNSAAAAKAAIDFLKSWNAPATVSLVEISALGKSVVRSENTIVRELEADRVVAWSQDDSALPLPAELTALNGAAAEKINVQSLRVTGLISGRYTLTIDGWLMGTFERDDFERGIDLTKLPTPMLKQASEVFALTLNHIAMEFARWEREQVSLNDPKAQELKKAETEALERRHIIGEPRTHDYEISPLLPSPAIVVGTGR